MTLRRVAINTAVVLGTLAVLYLLWVFRQALVLFVFSLAIAAAARPFVEILVQRGVRRTLAILIVYLTFLIFLVLIVLAVGTSLMNELQVMADNLARAYDRIWSEWPEGTEVQQSIVRQLPAPADLYESFSLERQNSAMAALLGVTLGSANFIGQLITVLILSIYWSVDQVHFERLWLSLLPVESRARSREIWRDIERDFGSYVRSELLQSFFAGILLGLGLWAMDVRYPTLLGVFGAFAWLIPWLGGVLAVLPVALVAIPQGLAVGIPAVLFSIGVLFLMEFFIEPHFIRRKQFSSLLSIILIIAMVEPFGLLGFIIAPPLAAAIELVFRHNLTTRPLTVPVESSQQISELRKRLSAVREITISSAEQLEPQTLNMLERLEALVDKADTVLDRQK